MPNRKTRERQLAKLAARRAAERRRQRRQRITAIVVAFAVALGGGAFAFVAFTGNDQKPSATSSSSATPSPGGKPGAPKQTGTITPTASPPKQVACGGSVPKDAGKPKPQFSPAPDPASTIDPSKHYVGTVQTSCGSFQVELYPKQAPDAVASFVFLAKKEFFDGLTFHRIAKGFVIQGGDPKGDGTGGPGYTFPTETDPSLQFGKPGVLAMAHSQVPDSNGSQWFVTLGPDTNLNPSAGASYTIFGKVIKGMSTIDKIANVPTTTQPGGSEASTPTQAVYIDSVKVQEK
jgi:cyclophilin family peptidyl-prolyl cis-trans isomerase